MIQTESDRKEFLWGRVPYFAITANNITSGEFRLYALLTLYAFKTGKAWPTIKTLCKDLNIADASVMRQLKKLKSVGLIKIGKGVDGNMKRNYYIPVMPKLDGEEKKIFEKNHLKKILNEKDPEKDKPDYLYFILDEQNDHIKIGVSNDVEKRLENLRKQRGAGELTLVCLLEGGYELEKELHERFHEFRLYGEYFQYSEQIKAFIDKVRKSGLDCLASDGR
ncbi:MAG: helix-turn-helix domain-containing protein [Thermotogota bacterium]|nr:helix-turn-helix domain-containing protein [Thermotogota bacterium]